MAALFVILSKFLRAALLATVSEFLTTKLFAIIFGITVDSHYLELEGTL